MSIQKNTKTPDHGVTPDMTQVHIAFHIHYDDDEHYHRMSVIENMHDTFGEYAKGVIPNPPNDTDETYELVFTVDCPVILSEDNMKEFFQKLMKIFNAHSSLNPHFTQYHTDDAINAKEIKPLSTDHTLDAEDA